MSDTTVSPSSNLPIDDPARANVVAEVTVTLAWDMGRESDKDFAKRGILALFAEMDNVVAHVEGIAHLEEGVVNGDTPGL